MNSCPGSVKTVQSVIQDFKTDSELSDHSLHPFSASPEPTVSSLRNIIDLTTSVAESLNAYLTLPLADTKLLTSFRECSSTAHRLYASEQNMRQTITELRKRTGTSYGEDIPLDRTLIVDWCVSRIESWATAAGMETFPEEEREGHMVVVLGGKVLVIDIDFSIDRSDESNPVLGVASVKTSYAIPNGATNSNTTDGSASLDGFLLNHLAAYVKEVQKDEESQDPMEAARLGSLVAEYLKYLMEEDQLAAREGNSGLRWFNLIDQLAASILEPFAAKEASKVASDLSLTASPLDILLLRGHALPLPYLAAPAISFLIHLSARAYLSLLRAPASAPDTVPKTSLPSLDIPFPSLRGFVASHPPPPGATIATLVLGPSSSASIPLDLSMQALQNRPTFPLEPEGMNLDTNLPEAIAPNDSPDFGKVYRWYLDFTEGGKDPGVVMSQSKMREIEHLLNPLRALDDLESVPTIPAGVGSWLDLIVNRDGGTAGRYTSVYTSPTSAHPPLQLRLSSPAEPGFFLERVPVQSVKQIWGILEIVKEQCWLNEILRGCQWTSEITNIEEPLDDLENIDATEEDLEAVLRGTITPRRIPVNVYITADHPQILDETTLHIPRSSKIVMTSPERPPITGLVETSVTYDAGRPRGIAVNVNGAMGADLNADALEEVCRRGGLFGLPGRIWVKAQGYT